MWTVLGRGSYFAGATDPKDVDVLVVTDELEHRDEILERLEPVLACLPLDELGLDLSVVHPLELDTVHRALIAECPVLAGDDLRPEVPVVSWPEWSFFCAAWFSAELERNRPAAALAAVRGALAPELGPLARSKVLAVRAATGTRWEDLAGAAWAHRGDPTTFDHPDLERAGRSALAAAAGEVTVVDGRPALVVYRSALPDELLDAVTLDGAPSWSTWPGGWSKRPADLRTLDTLWPIAQVAHACWWPGLLAGCEALELHRHPTGTTFPRHVDREEHFDADAVRAAYPTADVELLRTRSANLVAMVQPAGAGGELRLHPADVPPIVPELERGDVAIFDGRIAHEVSRVDAGERLVLVSHLHDA